MIWKGRPYKDNNFLSLVSLLHIVIRIFGYWPFSLQFSARGGGANKKIHSQPRDWIWFVLSLVIRILLSNAAIIGRILTTQKITGSRFIQIMIANVTEVNWVLVMLFSMIMDMINRKDIWKIINTFNEFDEEVSVLDTEGKCVRYGG